MSKSVGETSVNLWKKICENPWEKILRKKHPKNLRLEPTLLVAAIKINKHTAHNQKRHHQQVQYTIVYALAHVVARRPRRLQRRIAHGALRMARTHYQTNQQQA